MIHLSCNQVLRAGGLLAGEVLPHQLQLHVLRRGRGVEVWIHAVFLSLWLHHHGPGHLAGGRGRQARARCHRIHPRRLHHVGFM